MPLFAERLYEARAQILRTEANTIYAWTDSRIIPTTDFTLELRCRGEIVSSLLIAGVLDHVVTSQRLSDEIIARLGQCPDSELSIYLDSEQIADSLIIAMPANLRDLWLDTLWVRSESMPIRYQVRYFDDLREVDIAARLGQVDLLVMPEVEFPEARILSNVPVEIELNLLCPGIKDDLFASALNYCLRGIFADSSDVNYSSVVLPEHLQSLFPRNRDFARELFRQTRTSQPSLRCGFRGFKMYPTLTENLSMAISSCNGGRLEFDSNANQPLQLAIIVIPTGGAQDAAYSRALRELVNPVRDRLETSSDSPLLDSCLVDPSVNPNCQAAISRAVAEFSRLIPLGRAKLAVRKFDHVGFLDDRADSTSLDAFYTVRK